MFIEQHFIEQFISVIVFTTFVFIMVYLIKYIIDTLALLRVKSRYYDIIITKFYGQYRTGLASTIGVTENDVRYFLKKDKKTFLNIFHNLRT